MPATRTHPLLHPGLLPILDITLAPPEMPLAEIIEQLLDADQNLFIVRQSTFSQDQMTKHVADIAELAEFMDFDFIVHHHVDLADPFGACGVHLTSRSEKIPTVRIRHGKDFLIGYSAHSLTEAQQAQADGADYIFLGAIFPTPKEDPGHPILGGEVLKQVVSQLEIPVYAIGGINESNLDLVKESGAFGFSMLRTLYHEGTIEHHAAKFGFLWEEGGG